MPDSALVDASVVSSEFDTKSQQKHNSWRRTIGYNLVNFLLPGQFLVCRRHTQYIAVRFPEAHFFGCPRQTRAWWHKKRKTYNRTVAGIKIVGFRLRSARKVSRKEAPYDVLLQSNSASILYHSGCLGRVVNVVSWRFRAKRVAERDSCPGDTQSRPCRMAAGLFCVNASPLH